MKTVSILALAVATSLAGVFSSPAEGAFILKLSSDAASSTVTDNGAGDNDSTLGIISHTATLGNFSTSITVGTSNQPGTPTDALLQITSIDIHNNAAVQSLLYISLEDTDFTDPSGTSLRLYSSLAGTISNATAGDGVTFQSYVDTGNVQGGTLITSGPQSDTATGAVLTTVTTPDAFVLFTGATPFSMKNTIALALSANAQANISGTTMVTVVPEPASLAVLLLGVGGLILRRRNPR